MSAPTSSATIKFPFSMIDAEIQKNLEEEGVRFKPQIFGPSLELDNPLHDLEVEVEEDILSLHNSEARNGEFSDLENLLVEKGIPFDRQSNMDWNCPPCLVVFRPKSDDREEIKLWIPLSPDSYEAVVPVAAIWEIVNAYAGDTMRHQLYGALTYYLSVNFPDYPPLSDWVKGICEECEQEEGHELDRK